MPAATRVVIDGHSIAPLLAFASRLCWSSAATMDHPRCSAAGDANRSGKVIGMEHFAVFHFGNAFQTMQLKKVIQASCPIYF